MKTDKLQHFNAFGIAKATANEVTVSITAINGQKAINRIVSQEFDQPLNEIDNFLTSAFGAMILEDGKIAISFSDLIAGPGPRLGDYPQVTKAIAKAAKMVTEAIN